MGEIQGCTAKIGRNQRQAGERRRDFAYREEILVQPLSPVKVHRANTTQSAPTFLPDNDGPAFDASEHYQMGADLDDYDTVPAFVIGENGLPKPVKPLVCAVVW